MRLIYDDRELSDVVTQMVVGSADFDQCELPDTDTDRGRMEQGIQFDASGRQSKPVAVFPGRSDVGQANRCPAAR